MSEIRSVGAMLEELDRLRETKDLSEWEDGFVESTMHRYVSGGRRTSGLSERQVEKIEQLWIKHKGAPW